MTAFTKRLLICLIVIALLIATGSVFAFSGIFGKRRPSVEPQTAKPKSDDELDDLKLWYDTMAGNNHSGDPNDLEESVYKALPQGNGRLGVMIYGNYPDEHIELNEATFWSAGPGTNDKDGAADHIGKAQELALSDDLVGAHEYVEKHLIGGYEAKYQSVGSLDLRFGHDTVSEYQRELDMRTGLVTADYVYNGVKYHRESFVSYPDQVMVMRITADKAGAITMTAEYDCSLAGQFERSAEGDTLIMDGRADDGLGLSGAVRYQTRTRVIPDGGVMTTGDHAITVEGADSVMIVTAIRTNFVDYKTVDGDQAALVKADMEAVKDKTYEELKSAFMADYQELFSRVEINLGDGNEGAKNMKQRIAEFATTNDPDLVEIIFQYGRYMMICGSRDSQPMNLQGIWNKFRSPVWDSKYTTNINYEMNYWPAFTTNLAECFKPFAEKAKDLSQAGNATAKNTYNIETGWTVNHNTDLWNRTGPIDGPWGVWPTGGAWIANQLYDAYLFTMDEDYLKDIYPVIEGSADFTRQLMKEKEIRGQSYQVITPSTSPEIWIWDTEKGREGVSNVPGKAISYSITMDNAISRELFQSVISAAEILGIEDNEIITDLKAKVADIRPNQVGEFGQILEWQYDYDSAQNGHRHISQLYDLYPGNTANIRTSPELYKAATEVLKSRGDEGTGWSEAWKLNCWARLEDGNHAYDLIRLLITPVSGEMWSGGGRLYDNLWDAHPPFQIDGNFGLTSGIAEMLLQSQNNEIVLLPALPDAWPEGSVSGLCARGSFEVAEYWSEGKLTWATIKSNSGGLCNVRYGTKTVSFMTEAGKEYNLDGSLNLSEDVTYYGNVALGKSVTANGEKSDKIVDGDSTTLWISDKGKGDGSEIIVDLGEEYTVSRWVLETDGSLVESAENDPVTDKKVMTADNPRNFTLSYSNDGENWTVADRVYGNEQDINDRNVEPFTARYVKLTLELASSAEGGTAKVEELQLWAQSEKPFAAENILNDVILDGDKLENMTSAIEYSTDAANGFNGSWESSIVGSITLTKGDVPATVRIREKANPSNVRIMGVLPAKGDIAVTGVTLSHGTINMKQGEEFEICANIFPYNGVDKSVTWTSSNPNAVKVDENGRLTAVGSGKALVTAKASNGMSASCNVTAVIPVESLTVAETAELSIGDETQLEAAVNPSDATNKTLYYISSNPEAVSVDENGMMTAKSEGMADITVISGYDGSITAVCKVTVIPVALVDIEITEALSVYETVEAKIEVSFTPENATNKKLTWSSADTSVAIVDENGIVTGVKAGETDITVITEDGSITKSCHVTVMEVTHVESVDYVTKQADMMIAQTLSFDVNVYPADAGNHKLIYTSDNEAVAMVNPLTGAVKAVGEGVATIIAASVDGGKTTSMQMNITAPVRLTVEKATALWEKDYEAAYMAVDGDINSKWCHDIIIDNETCLPSTLTVKLDKEYIINSYRVASAGAAGWDIGLHTVEWAIEVSEDGKTWHEVSHVYENDNCDRTEVLEDVVKAQWVRLVVIKNQPPNVAWECVRIHEFEIFGYVS